MATSKGMKHIEITPDAHKKLQLFKVENGCKNMTEVIDALIKKAKGK